MRQSKFLILLVIFLTGCNAHNAAQNVPTVTLVTANSPTSTLIPTAIPTKSPTPNHSPLSAPTPEPPSSTSTLTNTLSSDSQTNLTKAACDKLTFLKGQDIYLLNPDGSEQTKVIRSPQPFWIAQFSSSPTLRWSPDGTKLAFEAEDHEQPAGYASDLYVVNANGTDLKALGGMSSIFDSTSWSWSSDSQYIFTYTQDGGHAGPVTGLISMENVETDEVYFTNSFEPPYAAPYFQIPDRPKSEWVNISGYEVPLNAGDKEWSLAGEPKASSSVVHSRYFSPNKEWLVITFFDVKAGGQRIRYLAKSNGSIVKPYPEYKSASADQLCTKPDNWGDPNSVLTWTPDSQSLVFATHHNNTATIWTLGVEDESETEIATFTAKGCPVDWFWSADKQYASISVAITDKLADVYVLDWPAGQPQLVASNVTTQDEHYYELPFWLEQTNYLRLAKSPPSFWDAETHQIIALEATFEGCEWSPGSNWATCSDSQNTTSILRNVTTDEAHTIQVISEEWSPNNRWFAGIEPNKSLEVFDVMKGQSVSVADEVDHFLWTPSCESKKP